MPFARDKESRVASKLLRSGRVGPADNIVPVPIASYFRADKIGRRVAGESFSSRARAQRYTLRESGVRDEAYAEEELDVRAPTCAPENDGGENQVTKR